MKIPTPREPGGVCRRCGYAARFRFGSIEAREFEGTPDSRGSDELMLRCVCPHCDRDSAILYKWDVRYDADRRPRKGWVARNMWPSRKPRAPQYVPEGIDRLYKEAAAALVHGLPRACLLMTRTTLSAMLEDRGAKAGAPLSSQIESSEVQLPADLIDAAHTLRGVGNSGAHDFNLPDEWTRDDAEKVFGLLAELANWLYERPVRISALKEKKSAAKSS